MKTLYSGKNVQAMKNHKVFIGFLPAAYPNTESFLEIIKNCEACGVDIFEFGYPPQNPFADGEVIKKAYQ